MTAPPLPPVGGAGTALFPIRLPASTLDTDHASTFKEHLARYTMLAQRHASMPAADQGHRDVLAAVWKAALQSRGDAYAKQFCLNQPGSKGKTPLMLACKSGWVAGPTCPCWLGTLHSQLSRLLMHLSKLMLLRGVNLRRATRRLGRASLARNRPTHHRTSSPHSTVKSCPDTLTTTLTKAPACAVTLPASASYWLTARTLCQSTLQHTATRRSTWPAPERTGECSM